ncbi:MAG: hypothetical protein UX35_C0002G0031 [Microgenomates group bacterium GW2011_GWA1_46_15]|nr:MAG: hypothetical protein UX00_C0010G0016 [Microgenomates group bacterium GW2011_GWB1_45_17]KKU23578.1 MAG: hypothetical protein UX36_C0004G0031 [Microgenomates group bacterium GW2011_GWC1_46_15]KKU24297.1 MAG: hypothetical protein UX35_C0002G0031 [Microgenomates group bacterium GW2011_GWA1_46_15]
MDGSKTGTWPEITTPPQALSFEQESRLADALRKLYRLFRGSPGYYIKLSDVLIDAGIPQELVAAVIAKLFNAPGVSVSGERVTFNPRMFYTEDPLHGRPLGRGEVSLSDEDIIKKAQDGDLRGETIA